MSLSFIPTVWAARLLTALQKSLIYGQTHVCNRLYEGEIRQAGNTVKIASIGDVTVGAQARLMSAALRKLTSLISKARTTCIFTNQIREKIGVMFGNPETTPGGKALKFYASVRIDIRRIGALKQTDGTVMGNRTRIKVVKNKVAPPFTEAEFDIMYNEGISTTGSLLDLALEKQIIEKRGSWLNYKGTQLAQGRDAAKDVLKSDRKLYEEIEAAVQAKLNEEKE